MTERILFVDDDRRLLLGLERCFRRQFQLETAEGGEAGLAKLTTQGPFAVVVADRQMPGMDGVQFLARVRQQAPETVRLMLTGNAELETTIQVVNEGNIFRFLTKPCPPDVLAKALTDALAQYRLVMAEKELLQKTLAGSIKLLTDILSVVDPGACGRSELLRAVITEASQKLGVDNAWEIHLAAMLAPLGRITLPPETLLRLRTGRELSPAEQQLVVSLPEAAARLLANIPRLEGVARIIRYREKQFDGSGFPPDGVRGEAIPQGARLLKILQDMVQLQASGLSQPAALDQMQGRTGCYDPDLLNRLRAALSRAPAVPEGEPEGLPVAVADLTVGMALCREVRAMDGQVILPAGHRINELTLERIRNCHRLLRVQEPLFVSGCA